MKKISLLGSTGNIGTQTLEVMRAHGIAPYAIAACRNGQLLERQAREFHPKLVCAYDETVGKELKTALSDTDMRVTYGAEGLLEAAAMDELDTVMNAIVGMTGLAPSLCALENGKTLLLANKEALVCGGALMMETAKTNGVAIIPVDSEHSAIFQCLEAGRQGVRRIILTASGGPFFGWNREKLQSVTPDMALCHPTWNMGPKVTVDSALLVNKGLEVMEAMWLFSLPPEQISVIIHRESLIHSLLEYDDNTLLAQLGAPDMRLPIQYALFYPERKPGIGKRLDLTQAGTMTFAQPDMETFPALGLAYRAARMGGNAGAAFNGAAEGAVSAFLAGKLSFPAVSDKIQEALERIPKISKPTVEDLYDTDRAAREFIL